jgi:hypothetical protein
VLPEAPAALARIAVSEDSALAAAATAKLRSMGPTGLEAALASHATAVARLRASTASRRAPEVIRLRNALDTIAAQRDAHASGLYWHTDLEEAEAEAQRTGKSILSLRLLGRLDEELSCANSRFFRTLLYPHPEVQALLRRRYVLHWSSERPAPRITIEMGDGRTLVRTITGNSVHYVLDAEGRPVDAIPGLYGPMAFVRALEGADAVTRDCGGIAAGPGFRACIATAHARALVTQQRAWDALRADTRFGLLPPASVASLGLGGPEPVVDGEPPLSAIEVNALTLRKSRIEGPMLQAMAGPPAREAAVDPAVEPAVDPTPPWWRLLVPSVLADAQPAPATLALVRLKSPDAPADVGMTLAVDAAEDTLRNEYVMHRDVHRHFAAAGDVSFEALNRWVYAELLLTPANDPWLGLNDPAVYDAVEHP